MGTRLRSTLIATITGVWAVNMVVPIFNHNFQPPAELNGVFMVIAGGLVAGYAQKKRNPPSNHRDDESPDDREDEER